MLGERLNTMKKVALYINQDKSYSKLNKYGFEVVKYKDKEEFIKSNIKLKIIHEEINHLDRIDIIKTIRAVHSKLQVGIVNFIEAKDVKNLLEYLELGANEYLKTPYSIEEIYCILNNKLAVLDEEKRFEVTLDNLTFPTWVNNMEGKYLNANQKFADHLKTTAGMLLGRGPEDFYGKEEVRKIKEQDNEIIEKRKTIKFNDSYIDEGKKRIIEIHKTPIIDTYDNIVGITGTIVDITELEEAQKEAKKQALTDYLTGLDNRRALYEYMENSSEEIISVMLIDIDDFKVINDTYGHSIGDYVVKNISEKLKEICKENFVCRLGGDEFLVIFKEKECKKNIINIAGNLCSINKIGDIEKYDVSLSIGIAINQNRKNVNEVLTRVDLALYKAKNHEKNKYIIYNNELEKERKIRFEIESDVKNSRSINNFKLYYQPQYSIDGYLKGVEALLRWENEKYKNIPISYVIKVLEESGLIIDVGYFIIKTAFEFSKKINEDRKIPIIVSINLSAIQIMHKDFIEIIIRLIEETKVNPKYIGIEITETTLLKDMKKNAAKIVKLRDMGMSILIDDFGIGYSTFSYIVELPITVIKIDKSLISLIHKNKKYKDLISLIVKFSELYDLKVVAEGVELVEQLDILKEINVGYIQGYLFSKPLKEELVIELINNKK